MLKIRDDVDLKELEKFGFNFEYGFYEKELGYLTYFANIRGGRVIEIATYDGEECVLDNTLYDLIQAGLVEKINEEEER